MTYALTQTVAPASKLITLGEAKNQLRVTDPIEDSYIFDLVDSAIDALDGKAGTLGRALVTQTWALTVDCFPSAAKPLRLPLSPVQSISSVVYLDGDGASQTLASSVYEIREIYGVHYLALKVDQVWPGTQVHPGAVTVTYVCGYGAPAAVPVPIKQAAKLLIGSLYDRREADVPGGLMENPRFSALLDPYRINAFGNDL